MAVNEAKVVISASDQTASAFASALGGFAKVESAAGSVAGKLRGIFAGAIAGFSAAALKSTFDSIAGGLAKLDDLAEITGASVENLSKISPVARQAGIEMQSVAEGMTKLAKGLSGEDEEGKGAAGALAAIGVQARDAAGALRDPAEMMVDIAKKLGNYRDGMEKVQLAQALFGKSGAALLPLLKDLAESGDLVTKVTAEQAAQAEQYEKTLIKLSAAAESWKKDIVIGMLPTAQVLAELFLETARGADSLGASVKKLRDADAFKEWGRSAANAAAFVIDAFSGVNRIIQVAGRGMGAWFAAMDAKNFKEAGEILRSFKADAESIMAAPSAQRRLQAKFEDQDYADRLNSAARMDAFDNQSGKATAPKIKVPKAATAERIAEIEKAIQSSKERAAVLEAELNAEDKLTEAQKRAVTIMTQLRDGKLTGTEEQRRALAVALEAELVNDRANEQRKVAVKQLEEENKLLAERNKEAIKAAEDLEKEVNSQRLANEEIGLTREQLLVLRDARMADAIAAREQTLAALEKTSASASEIEATKEQVEALRKLRTLRNESATKEIAVEAAKKAEEEWKRTSDSINHSLTDALLRGFEAGKDSAKNLRDTMANMFRTLVLRPMIEAQMKPIAQAASQVMGSYGGGGLLGQLGGLFGGGNSGYNFTNSAGFADVGLGFANGGSFMVGGSGGTDSQVVAFRASPDERVTIETPGQRAGEGGGGANVTVVQHINVDARSDIASLMAAMNQAKESAKAEIAGMLMRNGQGSIARAMA